MLPRVGPRCPLYSTYMIRARTRKITTVLSILNTLVPPVCPPSADTPGFEHGHALRPLCIREVRWLGLCGMGTPFELVRQLADWRLNFRSFWCCFAPCTET